MRRKLLIRGALMLAVVFMAASLALAFYPPLIIGLSKERKHPAPGEAPVPGDNAFVGLGVREVVGRLGCPEAYWFGSFGAKTSPFERLWAQDGLSMCYEWGDGALDLDFEWTRRGWVCTASGWTRQKPWD